MPADHNLIQSSNGVLYCNGDAHSRLVGSTSYECHQIVEAILTGADAQWIVPGRDVVLDVIHNEPNTRSTVTFGDEIASGVWNMRLVHTREVGGDTSLSIGVWMPGEGRQSIRRTIWNYMAGCMDPRDVGTAGDKIYTRCPNPAHGVLAQRRMEEKINPGTNYRAVCLFNIIFEKMCTECLRWLGDPSDNGLPAEAETW